MGLPLESWPWRSRVCISFDLLQLRPRNERRSSRLLPKELWRVRQRRCEFDCQSSTSRRFYLHLDSRSPRRRRRMVNMYQSSLMTKRETPTVSFGAGRSGLLQRKSDRDSAPAFSEPRFGYNFADIQVHPQSASSDILQREPKQPEAKKGGKKLQRLPDPARRRLLLPLHRSRVLLFLRRALKPSFHREIRSTRASQTAARTFMGAGWSWTWVSASSSIFLIVPMQGRIRARIRHPIFLAGCIGFKPAARRRISGSRIRKTAPVSLTAPEAKADVHLEIRTVA